MTTIASAPQGCKPTIPFTWNNGASTNTSLGGPSDPMPKPAGRVNYQGYLLAAGAGAFSTSIVVEGTLDDATTAGTNIFWATIGTFYLSGNLVGGGTFQDNDNFVCDVPYRSVRVRVKNLINGSVGCFMGAESWPS